MRDKRKIIIQAVSQASKVRRELSIKNIAPVSIYDAAEKRGAAVLFTDEVKGLEGVYQNPHILLSALRPSGRQAFTCAHELGHHEYGHGMQLDEIKNADFRAIQSGKDELIADTFAAHFLMPKLAIQNAFSKRMWDIKSPTPEQVYSISKYFGVSYDGLITHMAYGLKLMVSPLAESLRKITPKKIRSSFLGSDTTKDLIPVDCQWLDRPIDLEVGGFVLLPLGSVSTGSCISEIQTRSIGNLFQGTAPGECYVEVPHANWQIKIRVCRSQYVGWNCYRFEEDPDFG